MSFGDTMGYLIFGNPISQGLIGVVSGIAKSTGITPKNTNVNNAVVPVLPPPKVNLQDLIGGNYNFVRLAGISGGAAVIMGAYGKAIIDRMEDPMDQKEARTLLKTANRFHFFHTLALMTMPLARKPYLTGTLMAVGTFLFAGPMYYRALTGDKAYVTASTVGGFCLIASWLSLIF
ncbi:transmembrane protein 256 homolog [Teleopsis dalmanni]|uniref:transmembrane protein 256 homolog n=1 Tax=Teleopsis dalmanni TaxID=139649 RepID=UPI0018CFBBF5|nr:transmembrane protein 256 homolog [Teleopsis dalmanni]